MVVNDIVRYIKVSKQAMRPWSDANEPAGILRNLPRLPGPTRQYAMQYIPIWIMIIILIASFVIQLMFGKAISLIQSVNIYQLLPTRSTGYTRTIDIHKIRLLVSWVDETIHQI